MMDKLVSTSTHCKPWFHTGIQLSISACFQYIGRKILWYILLTDRRK